MKRLKILLQSKKIIICSVIFLIAYVLLFTQIIKYNSKYDSNINSLTGIILDYTSDGDKLNLLVKTGEKIEVTYYYKSEEDKNTFESNLKLGLKVQINGEMKNPLPNTIPNTFNYQKYLYNKHIYRNFMASEIKLLNNKISFLFQLKNSFLKKVESFKSTKGYMYAFILGDKNYIDSNIYSSFRESGVTHLFAVSGMHVSFLIFAIKTILSKVKIKEKKINVICILFLSFYMFLIGFSPSVVRASLLTTVLLINKKSNLNLPSIYVLYLLFIILVIINPFYIYDLGFIYSFLTSFGLMLFSKKITGNYFQKLFFVSFIAFVFSLPVTIANFYEFNLLTILNNIIIVPLVSLILFPASLIVFILPFLEPILSLGFQILEYLNLFLNALSINIVVPKVNFAFYLFYYLIIYLIYKYSYKFTLGLILLLFICKLTPKLDSNIYAYFLDVGQGDSTLLISKYQRDVILIDTGGSIEYEKEGWQIRNKNFNLADNTITFLKSLGIDTIDIFIGSHGDADHIGEALHLVKNFKVKKVIFNCGAINKLEQNLIKILDKKGIKRDNCIQELNLNDNKLYFLNTKEYDNENDNSNVLYTELSNYKFLIMGDASINKEKDILNKYNISNIDVLKVGHHGSKTSSSKAFIETIKPKYSIISVGRTNRYGHPHQEVLDNLKDFKIYRTDIDGSIMFKIKNNKFEIKNWAP